MPQYWVETTGKGNVRGYIRQMHLRTSGSTSKAAALKKGRATREGQTKLGVTNIRQTLHSISDIPSKTRAKKKR